MLALSCQSSLSVRRWGMVLWALAAAAPARTTATASGNRRQKKRGANMGFPPIEVVRRAGPTRTERALHGLLAHATSRFLAQRHVIPLYHHTRERGCPWTRRR